MCDLLCALGPATDGPTLFAKNSDRPPTEAQVVEWLPPRTEARTSTTYLEIDGFGAPTLGVVGSRPSWMWGLEHGVNTAGVAAGNATVYTTLDPRGTPLGLTGMDLVRLVLERAATAQEGVALLVALIEEHGQGGSGHHDRDRPYWSSFLIADPHAAFVVETSGREVAFELVADTRAISNRTTIEAFDREHRHPRQPVERLVDPRLAASAAVLATRPVTVAGLADHLRAHVGGDDGWTVCMHVPDVEATTASLVASLPLDGPPVARFLLGSPCRSIFVPVVVGLPVQAAPSWEDFAGIAPTAVPAGTDADALAAVRSAEAALEAEVAAALASGTPDPGLNDRLWASALTALRAAWAPA